MNSAIEVRAYLDDRQVGLFNKTIGCKRKFWNLLTADTNAYYSLPSDQRPEKRCLTPAEYKKELGYMKEVDALVLCNTWRDHAKAVKNHFSNPRHFAMPQFMAKHYCRESYTTSQSTHVNKKTGHVSHSIRVEDGKWLVIPKMQRIRIVLHREIPADAEIIYVTLKRSKAGRYYAVLRLRDDRVLPDIVIPDTDDNMLGLDYSQETMFVSSDGQTADPYYFKLLIKCEKETAKLQKQLSRRMEFGKNWEKTRIKIAKKYEYMTNLRKDCLNKLSLQFAERYDGACLEDLDLQMLAKRKRRKSKKDVKKGTQGKTCFRFGKKVSRNAFGMLRWMIEYKMG